MDRTEGGGRYGPRGLATRSYNNHIPHSYKTQQRTYCPSPVTHSYNGTVAEIERTAFKLILT